MHGRRLLIRHKGTILLVILAIISIPLSAFVQKAKEMPEATEPAQTDLAAAPTETTDAQTILLDNREYYFLQAGIFNDEKKASIAAEQIADNGFAGYVSKENQKNRVLGAVYTEKSDAESQKLKMGGDTYVKTMILPGIKAHIQAAPMKTEAIIGMYNAVVDAFHQLLLLQNSLDKQEKDGTQILNDIKGIHKQLDEAKTKLNDQFTTKDVPIVTLLLNKSDVIISDLAELEAIDASRTMELTAALKYNGIDLYMQIKEINLQME